MFWNAVGVDSSQYLSVGTHHPTEGPDQNILKSMKNISLPSTGIESGPEWLPAWHLLQMNELLNVYQLDNFPLFL